MDPRNTPPLDEIFHAAVQCKTVGEREAYLDAACSGAPALRSRVEDLLSAHGQADAFLEAPLVTPAPASFAVAPGTMIGPYKLLQEIGDGGMGVVYMAEQERPVRRKVALKVIKLGMDTKQVIARFEAERQALALMEHPNIARVLDAGATAEGRPFFVMELVRGVAIDEYCDKHQLDTSARLRLFMDTCRAVQHAHQKGIIHRDIKPGNVLVTSHDGTPVVKIIDFGVAKAIHQRLTEKTLFTEFRQCVGTPEYMSPEQAEMSGLDVDTRSDIYSLGVLLYQLLVGTTPFDSKTLRAAEYGEMTRIIREDEPLTPSTRISRLALSLEDPSPDDLAGLRRSDPAALARLIRGDIDWIVMKAIEKDRTRRYDTAAALADDVARHLSHEPVLAGPPSALYRARKLFQRKRRVVLAGALAGLGLIVGTGLALSGYVSARAEAERSNKISAALTGMLAVAGDAGELEVDVQRILATARDVFGEDHTMVAATLTAMAGQLRNAGDQPGAEELYREALEIYRRANGSEHRTVGQTLANLGMMQSVNGDRRAAQKSLRESIRILALQPGGSGLQGCEPRRELAQMLSMEGGHDEAEALLREVLVILRAQRTDPRSEILSVLEELLLIQVSNPRGEDVDPTYREFVDAATNAFPSEHRVPVLAKFGRGMYLYRNGRTEDAEPVLREVHAALHRMKAPPPIYLFMVLDTLFQITAFRSDPADRDFADAVLAEFLQIAPTIWEPREPMLGKNYSAAARRFFDHGRISEALAAAEGFLEYCKLTQDFDDPEGVARDIGEMLIATASQESPSGADLERALSILDALPPGQGSSGARIALRVRALRAAVRFRLGLDDDLQGALDRVRAETAPNDFRTFSLLERAEQLARPP